MNFDMYTFRTTKNREKFKKPVEIDGKFFDSLSAAARFYDVCTSVISYAVKVGTLNGKECKRIKKA